MLDAAREARSFLQGRTRELLEGERLLALSLVKLIEIIGEAASGVSQPTRQAHPQIPWRRLSVCGTDSSTPTLKST
jgi:uncharacterized protein with HEPN domain